MRKLTVIEFVTLDGVMQGLGSPDEDRDGGFEHGGWAAPFFDDVQGAAAVDGLTSTTAYLFGRRTYEKMNGYWPTQPDENPIGRAPQRHPEVRGDPDPEDPQLVELPPARRRAGAGRPGPEVRRRRQRRRAGQRRARPGPHQARPRRRVPLVPAPAAPRHREAVVPGAGPPEGAAARRLHADHHRGPDAELRPRVT